MLPGEPAVVVGRCGVPQVGVEEREELFLLLGRVERERDPGAAEFVGPAQARTDEVDEPGVGVVRAHR